MSPVLDHLGALADDTRSRLLLLLDREELSVSELCTILQLPQSTVSRHLKVLADSGLAVARAEGASRRYTLAPGLEPATRRLWQLVRGQLAAEPAAGQDERRLRSVLSERRARSQEFFSSSAGQWDALRAELFGTRAELAALPGLLDEQWVVGDLGAGTGQLAAALAPFVRRVIAVDESRAMLAAARQRLRDHANVDLRAGDLESLPLDAAELDAAVLALVLPYAVDPGRVLAEAARVTKPGGRLLVVDLAPHAREEYRQTMGHVWLGFAEEQMTEWLEAAGFERVRYRSLAPDRDAKGPALFAATGRRRTVPASRARPAAQPVANGANGRRRPQH